MTQADQDHARARAAARDAALASDRGKREALLEVARELEAMAEGEADLPARDVQPPAKS